MMRFVFLVGALLGCLSHAQAQTPRIDRVDNIKVGIISLEEIKRVEDSNVSTGERVNADKSKIIKLTQNIPATDGTTFGVELRVLGSPTGAKAPLRILWRYPEPGIKSPDTGTTKFTDEYSDTFTIGATPSIFWTLGSDYTLVPGIWKLELWSGDRQIFAQEFILSKP